MDDNYLAAPDRYQRQPYRPAGRHGLRLPGIGLGLWHNFGAGSDPATAKAMVHQAFDLGITHFDLANNYGPPPGSAELTFGTLLKRSLAPYRDELIIASKAGYVMWDGPYGDGGSAKYLFASLHQSLRRLGLDYVDIFYHHRPDPRTPLEETCQALALMVRQGKALYIGVSEWTADQIRRGHALARELRIPFVSNQPQYNLLWRVIEPEVVPTCAELGIGQVVWSPLAQGVLTGKYAPGQPLPEGSRATDAAGGAAMMKHLLKDELLATVARLAELADQAGVPLHHLALKWVVEQPTITAAIIGASRPEQVADNVRALAVELDPALVAQVDEVLGDSVKRDPSLTRSPHRIAEFG